MIDLPARRIGRPAAGESAVDAGKQRSGAIRLDHVVVRATFMLMTSSNSLSEEVSTMMGTLLSWRIARQISWPYAPGSERSSRMQSGAAVKASAAAFVNDSQQRHSCP